MLTDLTKDAPPSTVVPISGSFFISNTWHKCREQFAPFWKPEVDGFFFSHESGHLTRQGIADFVCRAEKVLELEGESTFSPTTIPTISWVEPHGFWKQCFMRRSLFTVLLRAGRQYKIDLDNFEEALYSEKYLNETKTAVMRFLFGFTTFNVTAARTIVNHSLDPNSSISGWYSVFCGRTESHVKAMLTKQDKNTHPFGDVLWR